MQLNRTIAHFWTPSRSAFCIGNFNEIQVAEFEVNQRPFFARKMNKFNGRKFTQIKDQLKIGWTTIDDPNIVYITLSTALSPSKD